MLWGVMAVDGLLCLIVNKVIILILYPVVYVHWV